MANTAASREIRLHTDRYNYVWLGRGGEVCQHLALPTSAIAALDEVKEARSVRIMGSAANAGLIRDLYLARAAHSEAAVAQVQIGGFTSCAFGCQYLRAGVVLDRMQPGGAAASVGGWHAMSAYDYAVYAIIDLMTRKQGDYWSLVDELLPLHPAWPAISFLPKIKPRSFVQLLVEITDPRWHIDPCFPDSCRELYRYLGLTDAVVRAVILKKSQSSVRVQRAKLVFGALAECRVMPAWFRSLAARSNNLRRDKCQRGCLLVSFIRDVWLHYVNPSCQELFIPKYFFPDKITASRYEEHVASLGPAFARRVISIEGDR